MTKIIEPKSWSPLFAPVVYIVEGLDPKGVTDVEILSKDGECLGIKRYKKRECIEVNVANYYRRRVEFEPTHSHLLRIFGGEGRLTEPKIRVGGSESERVTLIYGEKSGVKHLDGARLFDEPSRYEMGRGEFDEIAFVRGGPNVRATLIGYPKSGGRAITVDIAYHICHAGMNVFTLNSKEIEREFGVNLNALHSFELTLVGKGMSIGRRYRVVERAEGSSRICWVNPYGGVDYYTFPPSSGGRIEAKDGVDSSEWIELCSNYEKRETVAWLSNIFTSPQVWRVDLQSDDEQAVEFLPIEVRGSAVEWEREQPAQLTLQYRVEGVR